MIAVVHYSYIIAVKSVNNHRHRFSAPVNMVYTSEKMKRLNSVKNCDPICIPSSPLDKSSQSGRSLVVSRANPSHCCFCNIRHASIACPSLDPVSGNIPIPPSNLSSLLPTKCSDCKRVDISTTSTVYNSRWSPADSNHEEDSPMSYSHSCRLYSSSSTFYPTSTLFSCRLSSSSTFYSTPSPETLTTIKISKFKKDLKKTLLKIQNAFNSVEWYPDLNFTLR